MTGNLPIPHFDVIVIGAGSAGVPAALSLAKEGFQVLVIDSASSAGQGSNKKAIGGIRATHSDPAKIRLCLRSLEIFSTWEDLYGDDIEWYKGGYSFVAYREQEANALKNLLQKQKSYGLTIDWLEATDLLEIVPALNPHRLIGGVYSPDDGSASPLLSIHAFYRQALRFGAQFHFREKVMAIQTRSGRVVGVETNRGIYGADIVINAAGSWGAGVSQMAGLTLPVKPDSHEAAITEPVARFLDPMVVDIRPVEGSSNYYFYQRPNGQIVFCITPSPNIWGFDECETSAFLPMVARRMIEIMPCLQSIRVRRTWRGLYPMTPDGFPILGWAPELEGFLLAAGLCGQGFMLGPGMGELIVRMCQNSLDEKDREVLTLLDPQRTFVAQEMLK